MHFVNFAEGKQTSLAQTHTSNEKSTTRATADFCFTAFYEVSLNSYALYDL